MQAGIDLGLLEIRKLEEHLVLLLHFKCRPMYNLSTMPDRSSSTRFPHVHVLSHAQITIVILMYKMRIKIIVEPWPCLLEYTLPLNAFNYVSINSVKQKKTINSISSLHISYFKTMFII